MSQNFEQIWYIFDQGVVSGPFNHAQIKKQAGQGLNPGAMIWQRGQTNWQTLSVWADHFLGWSEAWYVSHSGLQQGPYSIKDISQQIKTKKVPLSVQVWTIGLKKWVGIYDVQ